MFRWRVSYFGKTGQILGTVEAHSEAEACREAIEFYSLEPSIALHACLNEMSISSLGDFEINAGQAWRLEKRYAGCTASRSHSIPGGHLRQMPLGLLGRHMRRD
jgi:hypothetical protein